MEKHCKVSVTDLELRKSTERQLASVKAANSRNIFFTASLFILGLLMGGFIAGHGSVHVVPTRQQALFLYQTWNSGKELKTKILNREGGSYVYHCIYPSAVNTALSANYAPITPGV